jgi:multidrug efflux pump subunit AcrA (membrane-fusion protein)
LLPGGSDLNYPVSYKSPTINTKLRTFEIKGLIKNPPEGAVPGAMTTMDVIVEQHEALGVPTDAVLERSGKKIVFKAKDGKAHMREVSTGMKTGGYIELKGDGVSEGTSVVVRGQTFLNDDAPLAVAKENR